jgi:hypothetical protein
MSWNWNIFTGTNTFEHAEFKFEKFQLRRPCVFLQTAILSSLISLICISVVCFSMESHSCLKWSNDILLGAFSIIRGAFGIIRGAFGIIRGAFAIIRGAFIIILICIIMWWWASLCGSEPVCLDSGLERIIFYTSCLEHILILRSHVNIYIFCDGKFCNIFRVLWGEKPFTSNTINVKRVLFSVIFFLSSTKYFDLWVWRQFFYV